MMGSFLGVGCSHFQHYQKPHHVLDDKGWYLDELAVSKKINVKHFDFKLDAEELPSDATIEELFKLFASAPRPVLIHCHAGADRSGLAAAL